MEHTSFIQFANISMWLSILFFFFICFYSLSSLPVQRVFLAFYTKLGNGRVMEVSGTTLYFGYRLCSTALSVDQNKSRAAPSTVRIFHEKHCLLLFKNIFLFLFVVGCINNPQRNLKPTFRRL